MKKKQIVFLEGHQTIMVYKIAKEFKEKGYETILIRILKPDKGNEKIYRKGYNQIIDMNISHSNLNRKNIFKITRSFFNNFTHFIISFKEILKLKPYVIFGRAPLSTPVALFKILFNKTPFIYFPYDIRSHAIGSYKEARKYLPAFEIKADRFCLEHSDGILHKGAPEELKAINGRMLGRNIKLPKLDISFPPYCSNEFIVPLNKNKASKKDKYPHFVYIGGTGKLSEEFYFSQLESFKELLEQEIHVHLYFSSEVSFDKYGFKERKNIRDRFMDKYKTYPNIKYFHLHESLNPQKIIKEISQYDFGITVYGEEVRKNHGIAIKFLTGNKISTYLEAGIPFFYTKDHLFVESLMRKYNLNLNWPENIYSLKRILKKLNYKTLEKNIENARQDFNIRNNFNRLEKFVKEVVKVRKLNNSKT